MNTEINANTIFFVLFFLMLLYSTLVTMLAVFLWGALSRSKERYEKAEKAIEKTCKESENLVIAQ